MKKILLILVVLLLLDVSYVYSQKQKEVDPVSIDVSGNMLSPNGDSMYENITFKISLLQDKLKIKNWKLNIINTQTNEVFDRFSGEKEIPKEIIWEGKNKKDKIIDGTYKYELLVSTKKKNIKIEKGPLFVDVTPPYLSLTSSNDVVFIDKEKNQFAQEISFRFTIGDENKIDKTKTNLKIVNFGNNSTLIKEWKFDDVEVIPQLIIWNGKDDVYDMVIPAGE